MAAAPAEAAPLPFKRCGAGGFSCARLAVPLDRSGVVPGQVSLFVQRRRSIKRPSRGAIVTFAGGPGQSASAAFEGGLGSISAAQSTHDLIVFDQRGTGRSSPLRCRALERSSTLSPGDAAADCAERLGPRRAFYTSRDTADDLEELRLRLDVPKLTLYGVSYGTRTALAYAQRYPSRVERLVLDSVVTADGPDALYRDTFTAVPRVLRALCRRACRSFTPDLAADVRTLVARMDRGPLRGRAIDRRGRARREGIGRFGLFTMLLAGDLDPGLRATFPGAVRAARGGDLAPLLRLRRRAFAQEGAPLEPRVLSSAVYAATLCEEGMLPWPRGAPFASRPDLARAAVAAIPEAALWPFDRAAALESDFIDLCARWPEASAAPVPGAGSLPDVPTLLIEGADDLRTPVESARTLAAQLPRSHLIVVPGLGHGVLSVDPTFCAGRAVLRFLEGGELPARCRGVAPPRPPGPPPTSLAEVGASKGLKGRPGRAARAAALTLTDVGDDILATPIRTGAGRRGVRGGGLRAGSYLLDLRHRLRLHGLSFVPGLELSGRIARFGTPRLRGELRVRGPRGTRGFLRVRGRRFSGRLGGRRVRGRLGASTASLGARALAARPSPALFP